MNFNYKLKQNTKDLLSFIPDESIVLTSDPNCAAFSKYKNVLRLYYAKTNILKFDYIVLNKLEKQSLPLYMRSSSNLCFENSYWKVRCKIKSQKQLQK